MYLQKIYKKRSQGSTGLLRLQKILNSPRLHLTLTRHPILLCSQKNIAFTSFMFASHMSSIFYKKRSQGHVGLLALKTIVLTSFTFDSHPLCNFRKKQVIREGRLNVLAKKQFEIILFTFDSQTVRRHSIFAKKKVTQEGGLATLTKKDWIHLIYFLTNALCNFLIFLGMLFGKYLNFRIYWYHQL